MAGNMALHTLYFPSLPVFFLPPFGVRRFTFAGSCVYERYERVLSLQETAVAPPAARLKRAERHEKKRSQRASQRASQQASPRASPRASQRASGASGGDPEPLSSFSPLSAVPTPPSVGMPPTMLTWTAVASMGVASEAAFNLSLIFRASGNRELACDVTRKHLPVI